MRGWVKGVFIVVVLPILVGGIVLLLAGRRVVYELLQRRTPADFRLSSGSPPRSCALAGGPRPYPAGRARCSNPGRIQHQPPPRRHPHRSLSAEHEADGRLCQRHPDRSLLVGRIPGRPGGGLAQAGRLQQHSESHRWAVFAGSTKEGRFFGRTAQSRKCTPTTKTGGGCSREDIEPRPGTSPSNPLPRKGFDRRSCHYGVNLAMFLARFAAWTSRPMFNLQFGILWHADHEDILQFQSPVSAVPQVAPCSPTAIGFSLSTVQFARIAAPRLR